jgi:hypothetical protein
MFILLHLMFILKLNLKNVLYKYVLYKWIPDKY